MLHLRGMNSCLPALHPQDKEKIERKLKQQNPTLKNVPSSNFEYAMKIRVRRGAEQAGLGVETAAGLRASTCLPCFVTSDCRTAG